MSQSRQHSLLEACIGTAIGFIVALISQVLIFPVFDIHTSMESDLLIAGFFTLISIGRSYFVRRLFNYLHVKGIF